MTADPQRFVTDYREIRTISVLWDYDATYRVYLLLGFWVQDK